MDMKKKVSVGPRIRGTYHLTTAGVECEEVRSLILRRRLQILVHSCIYYTFNQNLISDQQWSDWGRELVQLQKEYPDIAASVDYHQDFKDFDASTGYDLSYRNPEIMNKARWLLERSKDDRHNRQPGKRKSGSNVIRLKIPQ